MFIERHIAETILQHSQWYPILYLGGPRQSGKTTLLPRLFPELPYLSLELQLPLQGSAAKKQSENTNVGRLAGEGHQAEKQA